MKHSSRRTASHSKKSRRKVKDTNRTVLVLGGILFFYLLIFAVHTRYSKKANTVAPQPVPITMTFVGDIMFDRGVKRTVKNHLQGSYDGLYANASYLTDVDIAFANLEGPVGTSGYNVGSRFSFHMEESGLRAMKTAGFDIVSFANNHVGDYTVEAFLETLDLLKKLEIRYSGAGKTSGEVFAPTIIEVRGTRIGFLSASDVGPTWLNVTEKSPGIALMRDPQLIQSIGEAKKSVDVLVLSLHWGNEYSPASAEQIKYAHTFIDAGVDIIVGHHPHVIQKVEVYKGKPIFYSLGNFIFDQPFSLHTMRGMVANVSVDPITKEISYKALVSPFSKRFVPQPLIPFEESMLLTKRFTP